MVSKFKEKFYPVPLSSKCGVIQNSVNLKHSHVSTGTFRSKPARKFAEQYHSVVSSALTMEDLILIILFVNLVSNKRFIDISVHFTDQLTDFWATLRR
jgi:hypothetical protein